MVAMVSTISTPSSSEHDVLTGALDEVERRFREQLSPLRLFPGAALAIYRRGQLVLDLAEGYADTQRGERVGSDSLFPLFSGTKPFAAVALWQQIERGHLELDEPVATYWPAFGQNGKDRVLVRHILSHRGGFPTTPAELTPDRWGEREAVLATVAAMPLEHVPGTVSAYHFLTQHWVCAELLRRLDGRSYSDYLREEITGPLESDGHLRGSPNVRSSTGSRSCTRRTVSTIGHWTGCGSMSRIALHRMVVPGASGVSTARDMARFYAALAAGGALDGDAHLAAGDGRPNARRSRSMARSMRPSPCRCGAVLDSSSGGLD